MNTENLKTMSAYLKGPLKSSFDMDVFGVFEEPVCGCVAAHATEVIEPWRHMEEFGCYVERAFDIAKDTPAFDWIFSHKWARDYEHVSEWEDSAAGPDNTALGAAKRIDYLLEHGVPDDYREMMMGKIPLCY
jgi:hypothetical protein